MNRRSSGTPISRCCGYPQSRLCAVAVVVVDVFVLHFASSGLRVRQFAWGSRDKLRV